MVFRKSYSFNAWKEMKHERNIFYKINNYHIFTARNGIILIAYMIGIPFSIIIYDKITREFLPLKRRFDNKKIKQVSTDFYIYSGSTLNSKDNVGNLSLL